MSWNKLKNCENIQGQNLLFDSTLGDQHKGVGGVTLFYQKTDSAQKLQEILHLLCH